MQYREGVPESTVRFYNHRSCTWETVTVEPVAVITAVTERDFRSNRTPLTDFHERVREQDHLFTLQPQQPTDLSSRFACACGLQIESYGHSYHFAQALS